MQKDSTRFRMAGVIPVHQCCIQQHRRPHSALLQNGPSHGLMQAHRERHKLTAGKEVHCLNNTIRYPNMGTVKRAAEIYGLSPSYIRRLCKTGKIRYVNAGHMWLVNLDSLARYLNRATRLRQSKARPPTASDKLDDGHTREHTENVCPARRRGVTH